MVRSRSVAASCLVALSLTCSGCSGGGGKEKPTGPEPAAPVLAPLPATVNEPQVTVRGLAAAGAQVVVRGGPAEARGQAAAGTGLFAVVVPLAAGANTLDVCAVMGGVEGAPARGGVTYAPPTVVLSSAMPAAVRAGDVLELSGAGFGTSRPDVRVWFSDGAKELPATALAVTDGSIRTIVPLLYLDAQGELSVYVTRAQSTSGTLHLPVSRVPAAAGGEMRRHAAAVAGLLPVLRARLAFSQALVPAETFAAVQDALARVEQFIDRGSASVESELDAEARALLDRLYSTGAFARIEALLAEAAGRAAPVSPGAALLGFPVQTPGLASFGSCDDGTTGGIACCVGSVIDLLREVSDVLDTVEYLLTAASAVCVLFCQPAVPVIETIYGIVKAVHDILDEVIRILDVLLPTRPSGWHLVLQESAFKGVAANVIYTELTNVMVMKVDFSGGKVGTLFTTWKMKLGAEILDIIGIDVENLRVRISDVEVPTSMTRTAPSPALLVANEGVGEYRHALTGGTLAVPHVPETVSLDVRGTCGPYEYPKNACEAVPDDPCAPPVNPWPVKVIDAPTINAMTWDVPLQRWRIEGDGYSRDCFEELRVWIDGHWLDCDCVRGPTAADPTRFSLANPAGLSPCPPLDGPGRIEIWVRPSLCEPASAEMCRTRKAPPVVMPIPPDRRMQLRRVTPHEGYLGDEVVVAADNLSPYPEDVALSFLAGERELVRVAPDAVEPSEDRVADLLRFRVPQALYGHEAPGLTLRVAVDPGPFGTATNCTDQTAFGVRYAETAADVDLVAFSRPFAQARAIALGDLDGDGLQDLAVGVPGYALGGHTIGAVYLLFGPLLGAEMAGSRGLRYADLEGDLLAAVPPAWDAVVYGDPSDGAPGENPRRIGNALAVGDLDGDGVQDLAIGSTDQNADDFHALDAEAVSPVHRPGKAWVLYGRSRAAWKEHGGVWQVATQADTLLHGDDRRELGYALAAGDLDGDGVDDLAVGAPTDAANPAASNDLPARAYVLFGRTARPGSVDVATLGPSLAGAVLAGVDQPEQTGAAPAYTGNGLGKAIAVGDVSGDGIADVVLGAPQSLRLHGAESEPRQGAIFVLRGGPSLRGEIPVGVSGGQQALAILGPPPVAGAAPGTWSRNGIGRSIAVGNLQTAPPGAPLVDIVAGAPDATLDHAYAVAEGRTTQVTLDGAGAVLVLRASYPSFPEGVVPAEELLRLVAWGSPSVTRLGASLAIADLDGDGIGDLVAGAPGRLGAASPGQVWVLRSPYHVHPDGSARALHLTDRSGFGDFGLLEDALFEGSQVHDGSRHGFGSAVAAGPLGPYPGNHLLVADPLADGPNFSNPLDPRVRAGEIHQFYWGPRALRSHRLAAPLTLDPSGQARITAQLSGVGDEAAWEWSCDGRRVAVSLDGPGARVLVYDQRRMILGEGDGGVAGVATPAAGTCGVLLRSTVTVLSAAGTVSLTQPPEGWAAGWLPARWLAWGISGVGLAGSWPTGGGDLWAASLGPEASAAWQISFGDPAAPETPLGIVAAPAGGFLVLGYRTEGSILTPVAARITAAGDVAWRVAFEATRWVDAVRAAPAPGGGFVVEVVDRPQFLSRATLYGVTQYGSVGWRATPPATVWALAGGASQVLLAGTAMAGGAGDGWLAAIDAAGVISWQVTIGGSGGESLTAAAATADGGFVAAGGAQGLPWIVKVSAAGQVQWQRTLSGTGAVQALAGAGDGGIYAAGTATTGESASQAQLVRLDATGNVQWARSLGPARTLRDLASAEGGGAILLLGAVGAGGPLLVEVTAGGGLGCGLAAPLAAATQDPALLVVPGTLALPLQSGAVTPEFWAPAPADAARTAVCNLP